MVEKEYWNKKHIMVTGGAGFVGSHLVEMLVTAGANITVIDNLSTGLRENLAAVIDKVKLLKLDIREPIWNELLEEKQYEVIFHLAGNAYVPPSVDDPAWDSKLNFESTFKFIEIMRKMKWQGKFIYASSAAVYGNPACIPIKEDDPTVPISPYGVAKLAAERYISVYSQLYGINAASLRFFSLYGPRQRKQVVYDMIRKIHQNPEVLEIYGNGTQVRDFNYVEDTARAMMIVAENAPLRGEVYNVASGKAYSINELVEMICKINQVMPRLQYSGSNRPGDPEKWEVNIHKLNSIGYVPQYRLPDGIVRTVNWYKSLIKSSNLR